MGNIHDFHTASSGLDALEDSGQWTLADDGLGTEVDISGEWTGTEADSVRWLPYVIQAAPLASRLSPLFCDRVVSQTDDAVGLFGQLLVMGDHDQGFPLFQAHVFQNVDDALGGCCVKISGRFVSQDDIRVIDQGAGDGDALLFAAR